MTQPTRILISEAISKSDLVRSLAVVMSALSGGTLIAEALVDGVTREIKPEWWEAIDLASLQDSAVWFDVGPLGPHRAEKITLDRDKLAALLSHHPAPGEPKTKYDQHLTEVRRKWAEKRREQKAADAAVARISDAEAQERVGRRMFRANWIGRPTPHEIDILGYDPGHAEWAKYHRNLSRRTHQYQCVDLFLIQTRVELQHSGKIVIDADKLTRALDENYPINLPSSAAEQATRGETVAQFWSLGAIVAWAYTRNEETARDAMAGQNDSMTNIPLRIELRASAADSERPVDLGEGFEAAMADVTARLRSGELAITARKHDTQETAQLTPEQLQRLKIADDLKSLRPISGPVRQSDTWVDVLGERGKAVELWPPIAGAKRPLSVWRAREPGPKPKAERRGAGIDAKFDEIVGSGTLDFKRGGLQRTAKQIQALFPTYTVDGVRKIIQAKFNELKQKSAGRRRARR